MHVSVCHYVPISVVTIDNRFYSIIGATQDDVDDSVDVSDVDFAITIHVGSSRAAITFQDDVNNGIHISDVHFEIAVHVATHIRLQIVNNLPKKGIPVLISPVGISHPLQHMKRTTRAISITHIEHLISNRYSREVSNVAIHIRQASATIERKTANGSDGIWNGDACQAIASIERTIADGGDGVWNVDVGQASAIIERTIADGSDGVADSNAGQAETVRERSFADGGDGIPNRHACHAIAVLERRSTD